MLITKKREGEEVDGEKEEEESEREEQKKRAQHKPVQCALRWSFYYLFFLGGSHIYSNFTK